MEQFRSILLFGGTSDERRVSVASGQHVAAELPDAQLWFQDAGGAVFECSREELMGHLRPFEVDFVPQKKGQRFTSLSEAIRSAPTHVFFLAFHGGEGEDGSVQKVFEELGIAFTGSGSLASAKAFDKRWAKQIAREHGILTTPQAEVSGQALDKAQAVIEEMLEEYSEIILKPVAGGSSIGLYRISSTGGLPAVLSSIAKTGGVPYLCEPFIRGKELTVGIYEDGTALRALPPTEVRLEENRNFDYEGKYLGRGVSEITPAEVSKEITERCQEIAVKIHAALGCSGYSRTDIILSGEGPVFLETNTLPGLTRASFIPAQLVAAKIPFATFLNQQLAIGLKKAQGPRTAKKPALRIAH